MGDGYQIIAVGGIFIALFSTALILPWQKKGYTSQLLAAWLLALAVNQCYFFVSRSAWSDSLPEIFHLLGYSMPFIHFPLLYLFVRYSLSRRLPSHILWHFLPWVLFTGVIGGTLIVYPDASYFKNGFLVWKNQVPFLLYQHGRVIAVMAAVYTVWSYITIIRYKKKLSDTHANEAPAVFNGLQKWIVLAILFFICTYIIIEVSLNTSWIQVPDTFGIISVLTTLYIIYVGYYGISHKETFAHIDLESLERFMEITSSEPENLAPLQENVAQLKKLMDEKQPYLEPDFTISDLAGMCGMPVGRVSQALNQGEGVNFYDFTNTYRTQLFKQRIHQKEFDHYSILGLALDCGFSSKTTFNDFFKRYTGMTPSQYKKKSGYMSTDAG